VTGVIILIILIAATVFFLRPTVDNSGKTGSENNSFRPDGSGEITDSCVPLYKIVEGTNNTISYRNFSAWQFEPAPSPDECKALAYTALEPYGGMPGDAFFTSAEETSWYSYGSSEVIIKSGVGSRRVNYRQSPYGLPIFGNGGTLSIEFGFGGNVSEINKHWLSLEEAGSGRVIPASDAIGRLQRGKGWDIPDEPLNLTIHDIRMGYHTPVNTTHLQYLEPVWVVNATDTIQSRSLTFFVPALVQSDHQAPHENSVSGIFCNFSQRNGEVPESDVTNVSGVLIGTSGPVGRESALASIRNFTDNRDINLSYNGRFTEHNECGRVYFWNYYDFSSPGCEFKVETYTGTVLSATVNGSCSRTGIANISGIPGSRQEDIDGLVLNFTRSQYPDFGKRNMTFIDRQLSDYGIMYIIEGNSATIFLTFDKHEGLLNKYEVFNSNEMTMCGKEPVWVGD
jgi:hypothetical protein